MLADWFAEEFWKRYAWADTVWRLLPGRLGLVRYELSLRDQFSDDVDDLRRKTVNFVYNIMKDDDRYSVLDEVMKREYNYKPTVFDVVTHDEEHVNILDMDLRNELVDVINDMSKSRLRTVRAGLGMHDRDERGNRALRKDTINVLRNCMPAVISEKNDKLDEQWAWFEKNLRKFDSFVRQQGSDELEREHLTGDIWISDWKRWRKHQRQGQNLRGDIANDAYHLWMRDEQAEEILARAASQLDAPPGYVSPDSSAPGSPPFVGKVLSELKAREGRICELEKDVQQWMSSMTTADAISKLSLADFLLICKARQIRNTIKNMEEDPELQPSDESSSGSK